MSSSLWKMTTDPNETFVDCIYINGMQFRWNIDVPLEQFLEEVKPNLSIKAFEDLRFRLELIMALMHLHCQT